MTLGDFLFSQTHNVDLFIHEVTIMKQLILECTHSLELLQKLISNAGASQVGAKNLRVTYYTHPMYGHVFEVIDDGCGMNFTNDA